MNQKGCGRVYQIEIEVDGVTAARGVRQVKRSGAFKFHQGARVLTTVGAGGGTGRNGWGDTYTHNEQG